MIYRGLAITGTDTGAGKTTVACALAILFRETGFSVGVLKPVETGCQGPDLVPGDGMMLAEAAGLRVSRDKEAGATEVSLDEVVPWRLRPALAPEEAARASGFEISVDRIFQALDRWVERSDIVLVETAGGLLVPVNHRFTFADLLAAMELPVVVAAANRLGVINHALLTVEALRARDLSPLAVILCQLSSRPDPSASSNADLIRRHGGVPVFEVPYAGAGSEAKASIEIAVQALRPHQEMLLKAVETERKRVALRYLNRGQEKGEV